MPTVTLSPVFKQKFFANSGVPLNGGKLFSYLATTSTKTSTYSDAAGSSLNANPIILSFRGEADVYIEPNKGYKFVLAPSTDSDPPTNPIWTVDNVRSSQLITLYGGVDAGTTNAYVLTFAANFTAYTDGTVIYWIPSNSNSGASTININGLGPVAIVNQDGSALSAGQLTANQTAVIMYLGGSFLLLSSGTVPFSGTFNGTLTGGVGAAVTVSYWVNNKMCMLRAPASNIASNTTAMGMTGLPAVVQPATGAATVACVLRDNSANVGGWAQVNSGAGTITFGTGINNNQAGFTAALNKGLAAGWAISYPLG